MASFFGFLRFFKQLAPGSKEGMRARSRINPFVATIILAVIWALAIFVTGIALILGPFADSTSGEKAQIIELSLIVAGYVFAVAALYFAATQFIREPKLDVELRLAGAPRQQNQNRSLTVDVFARNTGGRVALTWQLEVIFAGTQAQLTSTQAGWERSSGQLFVFVSTTPLFPGPPAPVGAIELTAPLQTRDILVAFKCATEVVSDSIWRRVPLRLPVED